MLALLDHRKLRAQLQKGSRRRDVVFLTGQLAGFTVVDDQTIHHLQRRQQIIPRRIDPQIHRVAHGQPRVLHLTAHLALKGGMRVRQEQNIAIGEGGWHRRALLLQHV